MGDVTLYNLEGIMLKRPECGWVFQIDSFKTVYLVNATVPETFKIDSLKVVTTLNSNVNESKIQICDSMTQEKAFPHEVLKMSKR